jgi:hypothetical protein
VVHQHAQSESLGADTTMTFHERDTAWDYWKAGMDTFAISKLMDLHEHEVEQAIFDMLQRRKRAA